MKTREDMFHVEPSTSPPLNFDQLNGLVGQPACHFSPRHHSMAKLPTHAIIRRRNALRVILKPWDADSQSFNKGALGISIDELCHGHWVHYLRLTRLACIHTAAAVVAHTKTVSRRVGAPRFKVGQLLNLTDGTRRAGVAVLATVVVVAEGPKRLSKISRNDLDLEGFGDLSARQFGLQFKSTNGLPEKCDPIVRRIKWEYL